MGLLANGNIMKLPDFIDLKIGRTYDTTQGYVSVDKLLCDIVFQVRKRKPSWRFELGKSQRSTYKGDALFCTYDDVIVFDEDQRIGRITVEESHNARKCRTEMSIHVQSPRIKKLRGAQDTFKTYKPDVAVKTIINKMYKLSIVEYGSKLVNEAITALNNASYSRRNQISNIHSNFPIEAKINLILTYMNTFKEYLNSDKYIAHCDELKTLVDDNKIIHGLQVNPAVVIDIDNQWLRMFSKENDYACIHRGDTSGNDLPVYIKERLGILKLVDVGTCIEGKGHRSGSNTYLITLTQDELIELEKANG